MRPADNNTRNTVHGQQRAKERLKLNPEQAERVATLAWERGKRAEDLRGRDRRYFDGRYEDGCELISYNGYIFVFNLETRRCVTMFRAPAWFGRRQQFAGKELIRNPVKYLRYAS